MLYLSRSEKDALIEYLQDAEALDLYKEGYEEGFRRAVNLICDLISTFEG